ncbi:MAG TPA: hypothetical protein VG122_01670 [Gemmata sp.]|nr:hypothetical protein [Gemmata sp.]
MIYVSPPRRTGVYIFIGILFVLLFLGGAFVAYYIGKNGKKETPLFPDPTKAAQPGDDELIPGPADKLLTPVQAMERIGEIQTVEFKVNSSGGSGYLALNSQKDGNRSNNLAVHISPGYFHEAGTQEPSLWSRTQADFEGKLIRARGKLYRDEQTKSAYLEVRSPKQILVVLDH